MASVPIFHARVTRDGKLEYPEQERALRQTHLQGLIGRDVEVIVRKERTKRSLDMNAYLHAEPFPKLAEYLGYTMAEVKYVLMGECFGWRRDERTGKDIPIKPSTSDMTTDESGYFVDWVIPWAAQLPGGGVEIFLPKEIA